MAELQAKPEQIARVTIDEMLEAAGWVVQDFKKMNPKAGLGVALRGSRRKPVWSTTCCLPTR